MRELGDAAAQLHRNLGDQVVTLCGADLLCGLRRACGDVVAGARAAGMPHVAGRGRAGRSKNLLRALPGAGAAGRRGAGQGFAGAGHGTTGVERELRERDTRCNESVKQI